MGRDSYSRRVIVEAEQEQPRERESVEVLLVLDSGSRRR